jgi:tRNA(Ile)-lysidine synthetase-like protein
MKVANINLPKGTYVVAVSGGVDSMVLLDMLAKKLKPKDKKQKLETQLIVAHFDHGVRQDSAQDRELVQHVASQYGLMFVYDQAHLGPGVSEAVARKARYNFLRTVQHTAAASAIVMAHHQDDMLETAIINILRGTGRKGLSSLKSDGDIIRPLLHLTKKDILDYAKQHKIAWHEDSTNKDDRYLRNYVRHKIITKFDKSQRNQLLKHILDAKKLNAQIDELLINSLHMQPGVNLLDREWFIMLPHAVALEFLAEWLRARGVTDFDSKLLEKLVHAIKTYTAGKRIDIDKDHHISIQQKRLHFLSSISRHSRA